MIIELTPTKTIPGALTVWNEHGPGIDIVMDLKKLSFAPGSIDAIYTFHVLDRLFEDEVAEALANWKKILKSSGEMYLVVDNFEYLARAFVGGDITLKEFNSNHAHPMYFRQEDLADYLFALNFLPDNVKVWYQTPPNTFQRQEHELVISAKKHD